MSQVMWTLEDDRITRAWTDKYTDDLNFFIRFMNPGATQILAEFNPFLNNVDENPIVVTDLSFTDTVNQVGEFSININDTRNHIIDRDVFDNGMWVQIVGARKNYLPTTTQNMFIGYVDEIIENRGLGPSRQYTVNGLSSLGQLQHILINFVDSANRNGLTDQTFDTHDSRFIAWRIIGTLFFDNTIFPVTGGGKQYIAQRCHFAIDPAEYSKEVDQFIPTLDFNNVYASQMLAALADMTGADLYVDPDNRIQFKYPNYYDNITYVKDEWDRDAPPEESDAAWNTSYITKPYVRHGSTRPSDGFANYLVGVAVTEGEIEVAETNTEGFTNLVKKDLAQQFIAESGQFFYIAFVASKTGGGSASTNPATDVLRVRIVQDKSEEPKGAIVTQFFIKLKDINANPTIISPPPSNQQTRVIPGQKYWITWSRMGVSDDNTVRIHHDNLANTVPTLKSATRIVAMDPITGIQSPTVADYKTNWFTSSSGPTYAFAISSPKHKIILDMADNLSIDRWGQVDRKVESTSWIHNPKQLGEYMAALLVYSAKKRWIYNFPDITIPLRPIRAGTPISLRDSVLGVTGVDEVDAYSIIQEVTYSVKASEYALGTNTCSITSLGFQNPLDYTIGF